MSSLFWSSNFISLTQAFCFVKNFFKLFSTHLVFCADLSAATQLEYHKRVILSSTFFFRSVLFSFLWLVCDALSLSAWIEYTFFDTKSTLFSRLFAFFCVTMLFFLIFYTRQALLHANAKELVYIMMKSPVFSARYLLQQKVQQARQCIL